MDRTKLTVLKTFSNEINAEIVKQKLAANGIESFISEDDNGGMLPSLQATMGVRLEVLASDAAKANQILEATAD